MSEEGLEGSGALHTAPRNRRSAFGAGLVSRIPQRAVVVQVSSEGAGKLSEVQDFTVLIGRENIRLGSRKRSANGRHDYVLMPLQRERESRYNRASLRIPETLLRNVAVFTSEVIRGSYHAFGFAA